MILATKKKSVIRILVISLNYPNAECFTTNLMQSFHFSETRGDLMLSYYLKEPINFVKISEIERFKNVSPAQSSFIVPQNSGRFSL